MDRDEAKKQIKEHIALMNLYNMSLSLLIAEIESGIDIAPPEPNDNMLPVCLNCWFNKSFYVSMYLLRQHTINRCYIDSKWGVPTFEVNIRRENIELIKNGWFNIFI